MSPGGFSLVELMIATVILGIGLVMVATIFPVAVDQTRQAVQMSIVQAVADSAEQTLRLRVRTVTGTAPIDQDSSHLPGDRPHSSILSGLTDASTMGRPTAPSNYLANPSNVPGVGFNYQQYLKQKFASQHPRFFRVIRACNMVHIPRSPTNIEYLTSAAPTGSLYDPRTEVMLEGVPQVANYFTYVPAFTSPPPAPAYPDLNPNVTPHWIPPPRSGTFPRVALLDRVYPPVIPRLSHRSLDNPSAQGYPRHQDIVEAAKRRYCWVALGAPGPGSAGPEGRPYDVRILVMYRGELTARYATQDAMFGDPYRHIQPTPLAGIEDTLFPRPWLVKFDDGDNDTVTTYHTNYTAESVVTRRDEFALRELAPGTIICHQRVGELLPPGAVFVDFQQGRTHTVLQNVPDPTNPTNYRRLILAPDPDLNSPQPAIDGMRYYYPDFPDYAWVVPPPIVHTGGGATDYFFEGKCPVLAVFESTIPR